MNERYTDRRIRSRRPVDVAAYLVDWGGSLRRGRVLNMSASGLYMALTRPPAAPGATVEVVVPLNWGRVTRLHRMRATVTRVSTHGAGLVLERYRPPAAASAVGLPY